MVEMLGEEDLEWDENIYMRGRREALLEEDALKSEEDAFMLGYEEGLRFKGEEDEDDDDREWKSGDQEGG